MDPPRAARPQVWWHWIDGNISKEGIKADLEWMHRAGIGGFHQFDAGGAMMQMVQPVQEKVPYMQAEWKDDFRSAVHMADSLGMEVTIASAPGWSSTGGPWVRPEQAMKKLTWRILEVKGGGKKAMQLVLPEPYRTIGRFQNQDAGIYAPAFAALPPWYEDIAVVAVRLPEADLSLTEMGAEVSSSGGEFTVEMLSNGDLADGAELPLNPSGTHSWIQISFPEPKTVRSLTLAGGQVRDDFAFAPSYDNYLLCSDNGSDWQEVCRIPSCAVSQQTIDIPETRARYFRLMVVNPEADMSYAAFGVPVVQPTGTRIHEFILHPVVRVNHSEEKAGFTAPNDLRNHPTPFTADPVQEVVDLTPFVKDGVLNWTAPEGRWRIYRFGASLTGKMNHPAPPEATGLEVDKLDPEAWSDYFRTYLGMYRDAAGKALDYVLTDSYEAEEMTWTPLMASEFKARRGYDLLAWLPALTGEVIGSSEKTEQFLFDWRETIGELFAENYDRINALAAEFGMKGRYSESHEGGRLYVGDGMDLKRTAAIPMSAIWLAEPFDANGSVLAQADIRESASVAHLYGQNIAAAESFTATGLGGNAYSYHPGNLKQTADLALSCGLNRFVIHESPHQPSDALKPGLGLMIYGQWFSRHETWAEYARYWTDYLARSSYMLQKGRAVADILWYYGEDNNVTGLYGQELPDVPEGYAYDFASPHALLTLVSVKDGALITPSGMQYKVLVLGDNCRMMSLKVLKKLDALVREGAVLCGEAPEQAASLMDDPAEFQRLVADIWYSGRGNVHTGSLSSTLKAHGVNADFRHAGVAPMRFVHRVDGKRNIYWVRNFSNAPLTAEVSFRDTEGACEVLNPETGKALHGVYDGKTLTLEANQALFLVFDPDAAPQPLYKAPRMLGELSLDGPWTVSFDGLEVPDRSITMDKLASLTESENPTVKYFSGTITYRNTFTLKKKDLPCMLSLDLGAVGEMADVWVNGQHVEFLWKAPYKTCIAGLFKPGKNTLEIRVVNTWRNRLIGDAQEGAKKQTYTVIPFYQAASPLRPSGLIGPVKLNKFDI